MKYRNLGNNYFSFVVGSFGFVLASFQANVARFTNKTRSLLGVSLAGLAGFQNG